MALRQELLKSIAVAMVALSYVFGCCPLPFASAVAVGAIQSYSLLTCVMGCLTTPSKKDKLSAEEKPGLTVAAGFLIQGAQTCARTLVDRAAVRNTVWLVLALLLKRALVMTGLSDSPLLVVALATSAGALSYSAATALAPPERDTCALSPYDPSFWSLEQEEMLKELAASEMMEESPLASLAQADPLMLQLPPIEIEG